MIYAILLAMLSIHPTNTKLNVEVDMMEINHFIDEAGRKVFTQVIYYDFIPSINEYKVREWRLIKPKDKNMLPQRRWNPKRYQSSWVSEEDVHIIVTSPLCRETWTTEDPERKNRELFPEDTRVKLNGQFTSMKKICEYCGGDCPGCDCGCEACYPWDDKDNFN